MITYTSIISSSRAQEVFFFFTAFIEPPKSLLGDILIGPLIVLSGRISVFLLLIVKASFRILSKMTLNH